MSRDIRKIFAPLVQAPASAIAASNNIGIFNAWINEKLKLPAPHSPEYIFQMHGKGIWDQGAGTNIMGQGEFDFFQRVESKKGGNPVAVHLGTTEGLVRSIHELRRGRPSYKVYKTGKSMINYVDNWKPVERYIKKVQQRVGKLKSGWYYAGLKLGKMPTSAWIASQGAGTSIYQEKLGVPDPTIKLGSSVGRNYSQGYHFMRMAMNHRYYALRMTILKHLQSPRNHGKLQDVIKRLQGGFTITQTE